MDFQKHLHLKIVLLTVFCGSEKDPIPLPTLGDGNHNAEYQVLDEENTESRNETPASWGSEQFKKKKKVRVTFIYGESHSEIQTLGIL